MTSVAFVGGMGRSGSTLLEQALGSVDGVCALGETVHLWRRGVLNDELCSCGEPFSRCPFWSAVGREAFGGWRTTDAERMIELKERVDRLRFIPAALLAPEASERIRNLRDYGDSFARIYAAAAVVSGARLIVDSSKHASTAAVLRRTPGVEVRVVHLVRDSRGVAYSWTTLKPRPEAAGASGSAVVYMHQYQPWQSALLWDAQNAGFALLRRRGLPVLTVRYEDLLAHPEDRLADVFRFVGLPATAAQQLLSDGTLSVRAGHQVSGNPSRFAAGPTRLDPDERWRRELSPANRRLVTTLTGPWLVHYDYVGRDAPGRGPRRAASSDVRTERRG